MSHPKPFDSPLRWLVPSVTKPGESHLVDMSAYDANGRCTCPDFTCRHEPALRADKLPPSDKTRCKHIRKVRNLFLNSVIREMGKTVKVLALLACAALGAAPSEAFLTALALTETGNKAVVADNGDALGPYCFHKGAWLDADTLRVKAGQPSIPYERGAMCATTSRVYAKTLLTSFEGRLASRGLTPTTERLWLCWTMGFKGAADIGFRASNAPAHKRRGLARLTAHLARLESCEQPSQRRE